MSSIENSSSLTNLSIAHAKNMASSPTSSEQSLRNNGLAHVHQSYSSTTSLEKQDAMSTNNTHAFRMSPSYSNQSHSHMSETQPITTSTITTIPTPQISGALGSELTLSRSNHRNSPPTQDASFNARGQSFPQQENEAVLFIHNNNNNTTKTSNNHQQHFPVYPVPVHHTSNMVMNGNVGNGTTSTNHHMATHQQQDQHDPKLASSYHTNTSSSSHGMNGSSSSHQHSPMHGMNGNNNLYENMGPRSVSQSSNVHDKNLLPSLHILMDSPPSTSPSNPIPHSSSHVYAPPSNNPNGIHMRQASSNNLQQSNYMNHQPPITPIPYSHHVSGDYPPSNNNHVASPYINKASHHIDMFSNPPPNNSMIKPSSSSNMDATNMYAPRPIRSRSNTSGPNNASFNSPPPQTSTSLHHQNDTPVYSFEPPTKIKKKKVLPPTNDDSNDADKKNWKKKRLFSIDEVTDLVAFVKQRSENQELTRDVNYAIFKEYEKLQDERRRASVYRKKYVQLFERHLISKDGTIDPSLFQEYDQRTSTTKTKGSHHEDTQEKRKFSDVEEDSSSEGSNVEEEKKTKKVKREYSDEEDEDVENASPSEKKTINICVSFKGRNYLHSIEKNVLQNSESIHNYFNNLAISALCYNSELELIRSDSIEYFDYSFGEFIQINSFSIARVLKSVPVKLRIN